LDLAAQRDRREVDRDLAEQVVAVAAEELVLVDVDDNVEVAGGTAGGAGFAFTLETQLLAGRDPRRNLHRDFAFLGDAPRALTRLARIADDFSRAAALRAGARDGEEALLEPHLTLPAALRALRRRRALRRARSVARLARFLTRN